MKGKELRTEFDRLTAFELEQNARFAAAPDAPEKYQGILPSDYKIPEGQEFKLDDKDPSYVGLRNLAHQMKWDQPTFSKALALYADTKFAENKYYADLQAKEIEKLGAKGAERADAVRAWLVARVGDDAAKVITARPVIAAEIDAFEKLMAAFGNVVPFNQQHREQPQQGLSEEQYNAMSPMDRRAALLKKQTTGR